MTAPETTAAPSTVEASRRYYGWVLALLACGVVFGIAAVIFDNNTGPDGQSEIGTLGMVGMLVYATVFVSLLALNLGGFVRAISAHRLLGQGQNQAFGCAVAVLIFFCAFPFIFLLYPLFGVFQYGRGYLEQRKKYPLEHQRRIAELEAQLGIQPGVEGTCPYCGKPLQVDAEFCAFCGKRVEEEMRVCPKCGTVTLPGAKWCPKCGVALDPEPADS